MPQHGYMGKAIAALSLSAVVLAILCSLGQTQARYENYSQWRAVYAPQKQQAYSDHLTPEGQTVLLHDWQLDGNASYMVGVGISANTGTIRGQLRCVSDKPEYVTASLERTEVTADASGVQVQLTMTPTAQVLALTEQVSINVRVEMLPEGAAEPALWADYRVRLLPVALQTQQTEQVQAQTEPEETLPQQTEPTPAALDIDTAETFAWTELLAVSVTAPEQADTLVLGMDGGSFPAGTRYTVNGETFLLADAMQIETAIQGTQTQRMLLDLSRLTQPQSGEVTLQAKTLHQQTATGAAEVTVAATRQALFADLTAIDPVLTGSAEVSVPISVDTSGLTWRLEMLSQTEAGIAYTESDEQFYLVVTIHEETDGSGSRKFIKISNLNAQAPAGTYRLTLERLQEEQIISSTQLQFFVCY